MPRCVVRGCPSRSGDGHGERNREAMIFFHQFPNRERSPERYRAWLDYCGRDELGNRGNKSYWRVCTRHFLESDLDSSQLLKMRLLPNENIQGPKLRPGVIPTVDTDLLPPIKKPYRSTKDTNKAPKKKRIARQKKDATLSTGLTDGSTQRLSPTKRSPATSDLPMASKIKKRQSDVEENIECALENLTCDLEGDLESGETKSKESISSSDNQSSLKAVRRGTCTKASTRGKKTSRRRKSIEHPGANEEITSMGDPSFHDRVSEFFGAPLHFLETGSLEESIPSPQMEIDQEFLISPKIEPDEEPLVSIKTEPEDASSHMECGEVFFSTEPEIFQQQLSSIKTEVFDPTSIVAPLTGEEMSALIEAEMEKIPLIKFEAEKGSRLLTQPKSRKKSSVAGMTEILKNPLPARGKSKYLSIGIKTEKSEESSSDRSAQCELGKETYRDFQENFEFVNCDNTTSESNPSTTKTKRGVPGLRLLRVADEKPQGKSGDAADMFIVSWSKILELFDTCSACGDVADVEKDQQGDVVTVKVACNSCGHEKNWRSQNLPDSSPSSTKTLKSPNRERNGNTSSHSLRKKK